MSKLEKINSHQIELLKKYFPIDEENKIVTIKIYYEKATDMLDFSVGEMHCELMSNEVLEKITKVIDMVPQGYKANVYFIVDDYCSYDPSALMQKLNDLLEINNHMIIKDRRRNIALAALLIIIGFMMLLVLNVEKTYGWFGSGMQKDIYEEIMDISGWVFIWQAVSVLFLSPSEYVKLGVRLVNKVNRIYYMDKKENILVEEKGLDVLNSWEFDSKLANFRKNVQIITSTLLISFGAYYITNGLMSIKSIVEMLSTESSDTIVVAIAMIIVLGIALIANGLMLSCGILGVINYRGNTKVIKPLKILSGFLFAFAIIQIIACIIEGDYASLFGSTISLVIEIAFALSVFTIRNDIQKKIKIRKANRKAKKDAKIANKK